MAFEHSTSLSREPRQWAHSVVTVEVVEVIARPSSGADQKRTCWRQRARSDMYIRRPGSLEFSILP